MHIAAAQSCEPRRQRFGNSCYKFANVNATWGDALDICIALKSHLVEIETAEENNFIRTHHNHGHNFWTGGNDIEQESVWRWITSRKPITFFDWAPNQPSNNHHRQDCVVIHLSNHQWHDFDCRAENFFICEKDATLPSTTQVMTTTVLTTAEPVEPTSTSVPDTTQSFSANIVDTTASPDGPSTSGSSLLIG